MARFSLLFTASLLAAASCADSTGPDPAEQIFAAALAQWNELGPDSYDLVLKRQCICTVAEVDVTIQVRNGVVTSRTYTATGDPVEQNQVILYPDVPGLFAVIRNAMDGDPFFLSASYDQEFGYPAVIQLDLEAGTNEDNVVYTSVDLTPVP